MPNSSIIVIQDILNPFEDDFTLQVIVTLIILKIVIITVKAYTQMYA